MYFSGWDGMYSHTTTSRSGSANGNGRSSTPFTTLNTALVAPIPIASVATAVSVNTGVFPSVRTAYRTSCSRLCICPS